MEKLLLKNIANLQVGVATSRATSKKYEKGTEVNVINLKAFENNTIEFKADNVNNETIQIKQETFITIENGDILFRLREPFKAIIVKENNKTNYTINYLIADIRIKEEFKNKCLPEFLAIYLNSEKAHQFLKKEARGTGIISIGVGNLSEIEIALPSIEKQEKIIEANKLFERDLYITNRLLELKQILYKKVIKDFF